LGANWIRVPLYMVIHKVQSKLLKYMKKQAISRLFPEGYIRSARISLTCLESPFGLANYVHGQISIYSTSKTIVQFEAIVDEKKKDQPKQLSHLEEEIELYKKDQSGIRQVEKFEKQQEEKEALEHQKFLVEAGIISKHYFLNQQKKKQKAKLQVASATKYQLQVVKNLCYIGISCLGCPSSRVNPDERGRILTAGSNIWQLHFQQKDP